MKNIIIVITFTILFGGCTVNFGEPKPEEIVKVEEVKPKLWPLKKKEFWYAKYFLSMAINPNVQKMLTPEMVFDVVVCTVDQFEKDYDYVKFTQDIGDRTVISPETSKYIYDISLDCSHQVQKLYDPHRDNTKNMPVIPLKQSI